MEELKAEIKDAPKADVHSHLHLAGSQKLFKQCYPNSNINFPSSYNGLNGMIDFIYGHLNSVMLTDKDVVTFMELGIESAIADNVKLLEASIDIGLSKFFNNSVDAIIDLTKSLKEQYKSRIDFRPDLGINKQLDIDIVYSEGIEYLQSGIFHGIDLYGPEINKSFQPFVRFYDMARDFGLKTKVHAGEFASHLSMEDAILMLKPNEIQHGIRAIDSQSIIDLILEHDIRLNTCPTSNILLGAEDSIENHPIRKLFDHGIKITVNTDDLILFNASVSDEFIKLLEASLFTFEELEIIRKNGFD